MAGQSGYWRIADVQAGERQRPQTPRTRSRPLPTFDQRSKLFNNPPDCSLSECRVAKCWNAQQLNTYCCSSLMCDKHRAKIAKKQLLQFASMNYDARNMLKIEVQT